MAQKSAKLKKDSLALVVSTPIEEKGQKRKSKANPRKDKRKKKKRKMLYFDKDKSQERYNIDFCLRKVSNGKWVDYNFFDSHNFEFSIKLDNLG